jgi:protein-disulfide isomerase
MLWAMAAPAAAVPALAETHDVLTPEETRAFEKVIRDYILANPEIVLDALRILDARKRASEAGQSRQQLAARREDILNDPGSPVGWNPDGDVTIVEFFDYRCPYCRAVAPRLAQLKKQDRGIRYVYKEWPILGPVSKVAARAALAAWKQGRYEEYHEALMTYPGQLTEKGVFKTAERLGLDVNRLRKDMEAPEIAASLARTQDLAQALGITGTPAFVIGNELVPGAVSLDQLKDFVQRARNSKDG